MDRWNITKCDDKSKHTIRYQELSFHLQPSRKTYICELDLWSSWVVVGVSTHAAAVRLSALWDDDVVLTLVVELDSEGVEVVKEGEGTVGLTGDSTVGSDSDNFLIWCITPRIQMYRTNIDFLDQMQM